MPVDEKTHFWLTSAVSLRAKPRDRPWFLSASVLAAAVATVTGASGCGTTASAPLARPQVIRLGWHENCGTAANPIPITTRRLVVRERRWRVDLSFRNETSVTLGVVRPHAAGETLFGLEPFETASMREVLKRARTAEAKPRTIADRFSPSTPRLLEPGDRWTGSFAGPGRLPAGVPIRVVLGRFVITGNVPACFYDGFLCISERVVLLR
jgi:hypothetical protein